MAPEHRTMKSATLEDYTHQFSTVMQHVREQAPPVERVNVNFMARGDCLANPTVLLQYPALYDAYATMVPPKARLKMNMSTIMPHTVAKRSLVDVFRDKPAHLYYSLYSTQDAFRKRWMPKAIPYQLALDKLKEYQDVTGHEVTFHWAFIRGENDNPQDVDHLCRAIQAMQFNATKFNLVRLNPPPGTDMQEPEEPALKELWSAVNSVMKDARGRGRIVERIGKDVNASCGMFTS
jgi:adenine C2-methylase RlmN of 23S rRNA A2503 and tRNA A37